MKEYRTVDPLKRSSAAQKKENQKKNCQQGGKVASHVQPK
jgi:hypothetical protein